MGVAFPIAHEGQKLSGDERICLRTRMGIERCDPQRAFRSVPAQAIDEIDDWRPLGLEDIFDLPRLAIEWIMVINLAQFRQHHGQ